MDRVFLDANVLFSAAYRPGSRLSLLWALNDVELLTSDYAVEEARRNLDDPAQQERLDQMIRLLWVCTATETHTAPSTEPSLHEKDRPILAAAVQCNATHLLTGDMRHFGPLLGQRIEGVLIQTPGKYLASRQL